METCRKLQKLADFAGVDVDLLQYKGSYGPSKVQPRRLPSDEEIAHWYYKIPNPVLAMGLWHYCGWGATPARVIFLRVARQ